MNRGQHIHMSQLRTQNNNLKHQPCSPSKTGEVSKLKFRIMELEAELQRKADEIRVLSDLYQKEHARCRMLESM